MSRRHHVTLPSAWDIVHSVVMALTCLISYAAMTRLLNVAIEGQVAGMGILLVGGTLVMVLLGRREDIITTAITTIVVMVVAVVNPAADRAMPGALA